MQSDIACTNQFKCHVNQICSNDIDRWATLKRCFLEIISSLGRGLLGGSTTKPQKTRPNDQTIFVRCCDVTCWQCEYLCIENISNLKFVQFQTNWEPQKTTANIENKEIFFRILLKNVKMLSIWNFFGGNYQEDVDFFVWFGEAQFV